MRRYRALKLRNLREYQRYFVEVQYQDLAPADKTAAPLPARLQKTRILARALDCSRPLIGLISSQTSRNRDDGKRFVGTWMKS